MSLPFRTRKQQGIPVIRLTRYHKHFLDNVMGPPFQPQQALRAGRAVCCSPFFHLVQDNLEKVVGIFHWIQIQPLLQPIDITSYIRSYNTKSGSQVCCTIILIPSFLSPVDSYGDIHVHSARTDHRDNFAANIQKHLGFDGSRICLYLLKMIS